MAERKGFEPSIRYKRIHAFQACDFNHSSTFPRIENYTIDYSFRQERPESVNRCRKIFIVQNQLSICVHVQKLVRV